MTAVEWLVHQIGPFLEMDKVDAIKVIEQAKAMEKEQIIDAATWGALAETGEKYYNEKYNK